MDEQKKVNVNITWDCGYGDVLFLNEGTKQAVRDCCKRIGYNFDNIVSWEVV